MCSSYYHAFLGVAILISSTGAKSSKPLVWLPESIYIKKKIQKPYFGPFKSVSFMLFRRAPIFCFPSKMERIQRYYSYVSQECL
jgi:hypothetical protein